MKTPSSPKKASLISRSQIARVIFRTMRIEEAGMTKDIARKASAKVKLPRK